MHPICVYKCLSRCTNIIHATHTVFNRKYEIANLNLLDYFLLKKISEMRAQKARLLGKQINKRNKIMNTFQPH